MGWLKIRNLVGVLSVLVIGVSGATAATVGRKVVIAYGVVTSEGLPLWIAKERRFFEKYGLEPDLVLVQGAPPTISGLIAGDIHMGYTGGTGVVGGAAAGADLKIVATFLNRQTLRLIARPEIMKTEDLRGKRFGVQTLGGANWMMSMLALEQLGLEPQRDNIQVLNSGGSPLRAQALEARSIDFTVFADVSFAGMLTQKGFRLLAEIPPIPFTSLGIVVARGYIQRQGDVVENTLKALTEGVAFGLSPERKAATIQLMMKRLKIGSGAAEEGYNEFVKNTERKPYTLIAGLQNIQRLMKFYNPQVTKIDIQELVDGSFVQKLDRSGFLDRLHSAYGVK